MTTVKELKAEIETLRQHISALEMRLNSVEARPYPMPLPMPKPLPSWGPFTPVYGPGLNPLIGPNFRWNPPVATSVMPSFTMEVMS